MDFRKHWKKLMGVTIGRGRAGCATAAVRLSWTLGDFGGGGTSVGAAAEYSPLLCLSSWEGGREIKNRREVLKTYW